MTSWTRKRARRRSVHDQGAIPKHGSTTTEEKSNVARRNWSTVNQYSGISVSYLDHVTQKFARTDSFLKAQAVRERWPNMTKTQVQNMNSQITDEKSNVTRKNWQNSRILVRKVTFFGTESFGSSQEQIVTSGANRMWQRTDMTKTQVQNMKVRSWKSNPKRFVKTKPSKVSLEKSNRTFD